METPKPFPTFDQSGFYKQWLQAELAGIGTQAQSAHCLKLARYIYEEARIQAKEGGSSAHIGEIGPRLRDLF